MVKSGKKKLLSFFPFRRRQKRNNRRFCMIWINRVVNKQVEKRIAELRLELLLLNQTLREEMVAELQEELGELEARRERSLHYTRLDREQWLTSRWLRKIENEPTDKDEEDEANSPDLEVLSYNSSETSSDTNSISIMRKPPKHDLEESSKVLLDVCDGDTSEWDTSDGDTSDEDTSPQPAKFEQEENQRISSDAATVADTSQSIKEERLWNLFRAKPSFMPEELRRKEEERVQVDRAKEEEALLLERQWKEWMDKQEMRGNHNKAKPVGQKKTEKQGAVAPAPVPKKQIPQNVKRASSMKKIKTYLSDLLSPQALSKWERFEDED